MFILKDLNTKMTKRNEKVEDQNARIDQLVHRVDSFCSYEVDEQLGYNDDYEFEDESGENGLIYDSEPPMKKTKTDEESVFKSLSEKFQNSETVDCEVAEHLAEFINQSFRNGIIDDKQTELFKDIHHPSNCSALVKTRVNQGLWRLLKATTQTDDSKIQTMQNVIVKAAACLSKLVDKNGGVFDSQDREVPTH